MTMPASYVGVPTVTDPDVISETALQYLMTNMPGYVPSDGNLEVWMIMALAQMLSTARDVASIVPDEIFEYFGTTVMNLPPITAAPATVSATITVQDNAGYDIPPGTQFAFQVTGTDFALFTVVNDTVIPPGFDNATGVNLVAEVAGSSSNGLTGAMVTIDPLAFITGITATTVSAGGVDAETSGVYLSRLVADLQLLAPRPILPGDFAVLAQSIAGVFRAIGIDGYNASRVFTDGVTATDTSLNSATADFVTADVGRGVSGAGIPGGTTISAWVSATHVTLSAATTATASGVTITLAAMTGQERTVGVSAIDNAGDVINTTMQAALIAYLTALREVNFVVTFIQPTVTVINVVFAIHVNPGANSTVVIASVTAALENYLSQATWGGGANNPPYWDPTASVVRYLSVAGVIEEVLGVNYLSSLTLNGVAGDVAIAGVAPLTNYGTITGSAV
jgi:hypothetical protein